MTELVMTSIMITGFVLAMMLLIEFLNVYSAGRWQQQLAHHRAGQYLLAAFLGATPGCLGAFAAVAMYSHGVLTIGALVAAMVATSGDEAFVMFALFPAQALVLTGWLFLIGIATGVAVDVFVRRRAISEPEQCLQLHLPDRCDCFPAGSFLRQWRECSAARGTLSVVLGLFVLGIATGRIGPQEWNWIRVSLFCVSALALGIVATVSEHFLERHLWEHIARKHAPRIFLWTLGSLFAMYLLTDVLHLEGAIRSGRWVVLLVACLIGLIPESGPHLIFVTMYAQGVVPFSVLLASSISQDGHGMLPMLAHSTRDFIVVKSIAFAAALLVGGIAMALGW